MKTDKEIEQLAEDEFCNIDKPIRSGKDKYSYSVGFSEGYKQCQQDLAEYIEKFKNHIDKHEQFLDRLNYRITEYNNNNKNPK